jgi:hypothetical protein
MAHRYVDADVDVDVSHMSKSQLVWVWVFSGTDVRPQLYLQCPPKAPHSGRTIPRVVVTEPEPTAGRVNTKRVEVEVIVAAVEAEAVVVVEIPTVDTGSAIVVVMTQVERNKRVVK